MADGCPFVGVIVLGDLPLVALLTGGVAVVGVPVLVLGLLFIGVIVLGELTFVAVSFLVGDLPFCGVPFEGVSDLDGDFADFPLTGDFPLVGVCTLSVVFWPLVAVLLLPILSVVDGDFLAGVGFLGDLPCKCFSSVAAFLLVGVFPLAGDFSTLAGELFLDDFL